MKKKVLLGMSGGLDSSVAALLLKEQGYDVIGVTMKLRPPCAAIGSPDGGSDPEQDVRDAKLVADCLGIPHIVVDFEALFAEKVIDYFVGEYEKGRTPNPCIACNHHIKFQAMLEEALKLGCDAIATGHYAFVEQNGQGKWQLRAANSAKDQSYVLYHLTQYQLAHILMPMGGINKEDARILAEKAGLPIAHKPDSQEICFVPDRDYAGFIERYTGKAFPKGSFLSEDGKFLGEHLGITRYTIGQRKGLGVSFGKPMYVTKICPEKNTITLGEEGSQYRKALIAENVNMISGEQLTEPFFCTAKVRYQAKPAAARVFPLTDGNVRVEFNEPQRAVTPGQAVVFYDGAYVLGGGIIG